MSVVNKMLRDLEDRKRPKAASANYVPPAKPKKLWLGLGLVACFGLSFALYTLIPSGDVQSIPDKHQPIEFTSAPGDQIVKGNLVGQTPLNDEQTALQVLGQAPLTADQTRSKVLGQARLIDDKIALQVLGQTPLTTDQTKSKVLGQTPTFSRANSAERQASEVVLAQANPLISLHQALNPETQNLSSEVKVKASNGTQTRLSNLRARAHLASQQGKDEEVIQLLKQILMVDARELKTRKQLAALLFSKSMLKDAETVLREGLEQAPADSSLRLMLSRIHFKLGNNFDAFNVLIQHPYHQLANDELLSFRAALAEKIGEYGIAQQDYQLLVQRNPLEAKWWLGLGVALDKQRLNQQAIDSYQQAQQLKQLPIKVEDFVEQRIQHLARRS